MRALTETVCFLRRSLTKLFGNRFEVRLPHKWGGRFRNDYDHRDFCAIGASAGERLHPSLQNQQQPSGAAVGNLADSPSSSQLSQDTEVTGPGKSEGAQLFQAQIFPGMTSGLTLEVAAGITVAFNGPISGMAFIAEESAANLGGPIFYRALFGNCIALLVFNILTAAYNTQGYFWNTR